MYTIRSFHKLACKASKNIFPACGVIKNTGDLNIWQIPFKQTAGSFLQIIHAKLSCEDTFIACFWFCVIFAAIGFFEAMGEFINVYSDDKYDPPTFWNRNYCNIPLEYRRKARIVGSALNIALTLFLLYGIVNFRHAFIFPWIVANGIIILLEAIYWISNAVSSKVFKWQPFISVMFLLFRFAIILHVTMVIAELSRK